MSEENEKRPAQTEGGRPDGDGKGRRKRRRRRRPRGAEGARPAQPQAAAHQATVEKPKPERREEPKPGEAPRRGERRRRSRSNRQDRPDRQERGERKESAGASSRPPQARREDWSRSSDRPDRERRDAGARNRDPRGRMRGARETTKEILSRLRPIMVAYKRPFQLLKTGTWLKMQEEEIETSIGTPLYEDEEAEKMIDQYNEVRIDPGTREPRETRRPDPDKFANYPGFGPISRKLDEETKVDGPESSEEPAV